LRSKIRQSDENRELINVAHFEPGLRLAFKANHMSEIQKNESSRKKRTGKSRERVQDRLEALNLLIEHQFLDLHPNEVENRCRECDESITEMFKVAQLKNRSIVLSHLFEDHEYEPVIFPPDIRLLVKEHDVFLMTLGRTHDAWIIIWMSTTYS
jgi:hypothetical protein